MKTGRTKCDLCGTAFAVLWRRERDSNPCGREPKRFSRPPRYDRFDNPPCFIELSDVLLLLCATICVVFSNVRCILYHILLVLSRDIFQFVVFCCVSFVIFRFFNFFCIFQSLPYGARSLQELYRQKLADLIEGQLRIERAIESLTPTERELMRLRYIDGAEWLDVAAKIHYEWTQTHRIHARALAKIRDL